MVWHLHNIRQSKWRMREEVGGIRVHTAHWCSWGKARFTTLRVNRNYVNDENDNHVNDENENLGNTQGIIELSA
jgi:hypothetical protein